MKNCATCGNEFKPRGSTSKYCSEKCREIGKKLYDQSRYTLAADRIKPRPCAHCGIPFTPLQSNGKYCSRTCKRAYLYLFGGDHGPKHTSDDYQVTTPYGSHAFDWWVKCSLEGGGAVSHA